MEATGSLACGFYGNYVFFLLRDRYGLGNLGNLSVSAFQGLVFAVAAWQGGRFAQRRGYFTALRLGLVGMSAALLLGQWLEGLVVQVAVLAAWTTSMCFTWPALEALVSQGEPAADLPRMVGIYNVVWATCSATSYFVGGAVVDHLGLGSIFWLPASVYVGELLLVAWVEARAAERVSLGVAATEHRGGHGAELQDFPTTRRGHPRTFLHLAWLANPFACIGINTVLAMAPGLARELHLSTTAAGLFCSVWFFGRLAAFIVLWQWRGWHYRFRWLLGAFLGLLAGFATLLIARDFPVLFVAQIVFGLSVGLIYYSSLYYSMNAGASQGEHGGLHEAAMGAGNCVGPAVGAAALLLAPGTANAGTYAVSGLLSLGLVALLGLRTRRLVVASNPILRR